MSRTDTARTPTSQPRVTRDTLAPLSLDDRRGGEEGGEEEEVGRKEGREGTVGRRPGYKVTRNSGALFTA